MTAINLKQQLATYDHSLQPRTVGRFNGMDVKVLKSKGHFAWDAHDDTDDFFLVLHGELDIEMRHDTIRLGPGEMYVVPRGVAHRPVARVEAHFLLIEQTGRPCAGNAATAAARRVM